MVGVHEVEVKGSFMVFIEYVRIEIVVERNLKNTESFVRIAILNYKVQQRLTIL